MGFEEKKDFEMNSWADLRSWVRNFSLEVNPSDILGRGEHLTLTLLLSFSAMTVTLPGHLRIMNLFSPILCR